MATEPARFGAPQASTGAVPIPPLAGATGPAPAGATGPAPAGATGPAPAGALQASTGATDPAPAGALQASTDAVPIPPLAPGAPPLAILVDYDGTIAQTDVSDALMARYVTEAWEAKAADYDAGLIGSRRLMEWEVGLITASPDQLRAEAAAQPHDVGFADLVGRARAAGIPVEVVSDGFGFFIEPALAALGVGDVPIVTASTTFDRAGRARIDFPNGHPRCFVCGTCKRNRVLAHQAAGRAVVFIGDGASDRYAAGYSDVVFAKDGLVQLCLDNGWPFRRWTTFSEIVAWLGVVLDAWRSEPSSLPRPVAKPFFCGPEVWGEGRWDPVGVGVAEAGVAPPGAAPAPPGGGVAPPGAGLAAPGAGVAAPEAEAAPPETADGGEGSVPG